MLEFDDTRESLGRGTGADDETTRRDFESDGEEDQLDGGGGDRRRLRPDHAADEATLRGDRLRAAGGRGIDGHGDGRSAGGDRNEGGVLRAVQRPGEPLLLHADGRRQGGQEPADAGGSSDARVGRADDRGVLAGGAGTVGAELRYLAKPAAAGVTAGRYYEPGGGQPVSAGEIYRRVQRPVFDRGPGARNGVPALQPARPGPRLL